MDAGRITRCIRNMECLFADKTILMFNETSPLLRDRVCPVCCWVFRCTFLNLYAMCIFMVEAGV